MRNIKRLFLLFIICAPLLFLSALVFAQQYGRREKMWPETYKSNRKEWVDYGEDGDTLSRVDFEKGRFEIQALIPVPEPKPGHGRGGARLGDLDQAQWEKVKVMAQAKIAHQVERMLSRAEPGKPPVLKDQVLDPDDKFFVEAKHAARYTRDHLIPHMVVEDKPVIAAGRRPRLRIRVQFELIPEHMLVRARRYKAEVDECAKEFDLEPALIYAVIHSESFFNPLCTSEVGALGLMQVTPEAAAEAYNYIHNTKKKRPISPDYLYDPVNNITLGSAYLHILQTVYFGTLKNPDYRRTLSIAAYNCGPEAVLKHVVAKNNIDALSSEEMLKLVLKHVPRETRYYVPRVEERMVLYTGT